MTAPDYICTVAILSSGVWREQRGGGRGKGNRVHKRERRLDLHSDSLSLSGLYFTAVLCLRQFPFVSGRAILSLGLRLRASLCLSVPLSARVSH